MSKCEKCDQYEVDENTDKRGWCRREHKWVDWNDTPEYTDCGYKD